MKRTSVDDGMMTGKAELKPEAYREARTNSA